MLDGFNEAGLDLTRMAGAQRMSLEKASGGWKSFNEAGLDLTRMVMPQRVPERYPERSVDKLQ